MCVCVGGGGGGRRDTRRPLYVCMCRFNHPRTFDKAFICILPILLISNVYLIGHVNCLYHHQ